MEKYYKRLNFISALYLKELLIENNICINKELSKSEIIDIMIVSIKDVDSFINNNFPLPVGPKDC